MAPIRREEDTVPKTILLSSVAVHAGDRSVCPICNESKTSRARTCINCRRRFGKAATDAVEQVIETIEQTKAGNEAALKGDDRKRQVVWGPVLAMVRVNKKASMRYSEKGIEPYMEMRKPLEDGGYIQVFLFGANEKDAGKTVTAMVELKTKVTKGWVNGKSATISVPYIRAQKVEGAIMADHRLSFAEESFVVALPMQDITTLAPTKDGDGRAIITTIGFRPVV